MSLRASRGHEPIGRFSQESLHRGLNRCRVTDKAERGPQGHRTAGSSGDRPPALAPRPWHLEGCRSPVPLRRLLGPGSARGRAGWQPQGVGTCPRDSKGTAGSRPSAPPVSQPLSTPSLAEVSGEPLPRERAAGLTRGGHQGEGAGPASHFLAGKSLVSLRAHICTTGQEDRAQLRPRFVIGGALTATYKFLSLCVPRPLPRPASQQLGALPLK